ncbi:M1 family peptidase [Hymenobacter sp. BT175]|uniref:M1 family metallopeptidase n=1 Tax=Hymenobacter translucens TaxID=2886507 RepID=UPI001D0E7B71|nr:M1 family metallopeptidase [Hymenobacter translucens]MCC2546510.1 M1 family peptidase [Hymenobacter translucens]
MRTFLLTLVGALALTSGALAQQPTPTSYRATARKVNELVHTKLDLRFDYPKRYAYGKAWLTLKPYAYATDSLRLDAKGMDINAVALVTGTAIQPLQYDYNRRQLLLRLGRMVPAGEAYTIYIEYTARPDELGAKGSAAIRDAKGLYFINPDSAVAGKPVQIWTQGETDANSAWFPTIDQPNQKSTSEISLTVPAKYVTLSNGLLTSQVAAGAGLRTDTWKMDQPHAPYLFMLAVGDFRITKDTWRNRELSYYLEPKYADQAKAIFGTTPRMLDFFSDRLGVEFPWSKYAQVVARDYVSGAMENTTASLFGEQAQGSARELLDWEYSGVEREIAHELFHHWFGDYVTAESWSNLTINESFANFSEVLWAEHAYGPDGGAAQAYRSLRTYLGNPGNYPKPLVRFQYADKEDLFDAVTYQKGGSILNMLRSYLGSDAFFRGLKLFLTQNAYGTGEAQQLRLALEQASGQDLSWFFNQWYYGAGHPVVTIDYAWDEARREQQVTIRQTQPGPVFQLPISVDVYVNGQPRRHQVMMQQATQTFRFPAAARPELVNVDAEKVLVWQKTDNKPLTGYAAQYRQAAGYMDRREALTAALGKAAEPGAQKLLLAGLTDPHYSLRVLTVQGLDLKNAALRKAATPVLERLAATDASVKVQAEALLALARLGDKRQEKRFRKALESRSYGVQAAALRGLLALNPKEALTQATAFEADNRGALTAALVEVYGATGGAAQWASVLSKYDAAKPVARLELMPGFLALLRRLDDPAALAQGVDRIKELAIEAKPYGLHVRLIEALRQLQQAKAGDALTGSAITGAIREIEAAK